MLRFFKPARGKEIHQRGYFSYITEAVVHIQNLYLTFPNETFKIYYDLEDIYGYGKGNIYDICFIQDKQDWIEHRKSYVDIESLSLKTSLDPYNSKTFSKENLEMTEKIIKNHFLFNEKMEYLFYSRFPQINFENTIGFHRRATDMETVHNLTTIQLSQIFDILDKEEFENIFLMSDNIQDKNQFLERYGERLITFDDFSSNNEKLPFFKQQNNEDSIKKHIQEIVFGAVGLGRTKKLFCTTSNLSTFSIFSNSKLNYVRLN